MSIDDLERTDEAAPSRGTGADAVGSDDALVDAHSGSLSSK